MPLGAGASAGLAFSLPPTVDAEKIEADSKVGVLVIHLPNRGEAQEHPGEGELTHRVLVTVP